MTEEPLFLGHPWAEGAGSVLGFLGDHSSSPLSFRSQKGEELWDGGQPSKQLCL